MHVSSKTPFEKLGGKNGSWRKEYISNGFCIAHVASSKTLCEKPSSKNSQRGKRVQHKTFLII
jgi:hypothetical protein